MRLIPKLILALLGIASIVADYFMPHNTGQVFGSLLGALLTGAGVQTVFPGQTQCEDMIVIGSVDTAMPLSGLQIETGGVAKINISNSQPLMSSFAKFMMQVVGSGVIGLILKVSTGAIRQNTTYRFTNNGATTPNIYATSDAANGVAVEATTVGINASSYQDFTDFTALMITPFANLNNCDVYFNDGQKSTMTAIELNAMFSFQNPSQATGVLDAVVSTIDNRGRRISKVRVNATTALTVLIMKLPAESFDQLTSNQ